MYNEQFDPQTSIFIKYKVKNQNLPNLWLIHGLAESSKCFDSLYFSNITRYFNIYSMDLPGFGRSSLDLNFHLETIGNELNQLINRYCPHGDLYLAGHSLGGTIAVLIASLNAKNLKLLLNIDGLLIKNTRDTSSYSNVTSFSNAHEFKKSMLKNLNDLKNKDKFIFRYIDNVSKVEEGILFRWSYALVHILSMNIFERFLNIKCEKIYIYGENSINKLNIDKIKKSSIKQYAIPKIGHWPMLEDENKFIETILSILSPYVVSK